MEVKNRKEKNQNFCCEICNYITINKYDFEKHLTTPKHEKASLEALGSQKLAKQKVCYFCHYCHYTCYNKTNFNAHNNTQKHLIKIANSSNNNSDKKCKIHQCINCNKIYANSGGLWKHSQKCIIREPDKNITENTTDLSQVLTPEVFFEFFKQSKDLQNLLVEQNKELFSQNVLHQKQMFELAQKHSVNNSHNTTTNNTNFNLQFFLNETCKDAMNITDFVNSLQLTTKDFENTGRLGYVEGISRIIINEMKDIDVEKRPIHCTDLKRETIYIKHDNIWEKEEPGKKKLKWAVDSVARLNLQQIDKWQQENPEYKIGESTKNFEYMKYFSAALGGQYKEEHEKFSEKIIRNVLKEVTIDKSM